MTAAKRSGTELRQARVVKEAIRREASFLGNLAGAQDDYEWIVACEAWIDLGYDTFADWWQVRVHPIMRALSMRPTRDLAVKVVERVRAAEAELPPAQRRTQRELANLAGVHPDTLSGRKRQDPHQAELPLSVDLDGHELDPGLAGPAPDDEQASMPSGTAAEDGSHPSSAAPDHPAGTTCEKCGTGIGDDGYRRCADCDPDGMHTAGDDGSCRLCALLATVPDAYVPIVVGEGVHGLQLECRCGAVVSHLKAGMPLGIALVEAHLHHGTCST